ncbi:tetratricopeptide repeat protein [Arcticibacter sp. MXS-1]|uniref:tetratricopeptide repeat protein n=1 Tax=Arcticibacter sp. MXS-1 TaxID=3341726 RepID=UPI0035A81B6B
MSNHAVLLFILLTLPFGKIKAQDAATLSSEASQLNKAGKYEAAIQKFKEVLKIGPDNINAKYQIAFCLYNTGRENEAIPYLEAVTISSKQAAVLSSSFALLGGIYDKQKNSQKSVTCYTRAIELDSLNQDLYYSRGLAYFRAQKYQQAETDAVRSVILNHSHSASFRLYALVSFHQNKRAAALLGLCHFLFLDPFGPFAQESYNNIQSILRGGNLKEESKAAATVPDQKSLALNAVISKAIASAKPENASKRALFSAQLASIFRNLDLSAPSSPDGFLSDKLIPLYSGIYSAGHTTAFAYYISQTWDAAAATWVRDHNEQVEQMKHFISSRM